MHILHCSLKRRAASSIVYVSNVDEKEFLKFGAEILKPHSDRIKKLGNVKYKILINILSQSQSLNIIN